MMIGAYATWYFTDLAKLPFPVAVVLAVALAAVAGLIADQALRLRMGQRGRQMVEERFSSHSIGQATVAVYQRALARNT